VQSIQRIHQYRQAGTGEAEMILPVVSYPFHQESIIGYLWRLSRDNGYMDMWKCIAAQEWSLKRTDMRLYGLKGIAASVASSTELEAERILESLEAQHQYTFIKKATNFHEVLQDWRLDSPRICYQCLHEFGYIHSCFDNIPMRVCPVHNNKVLECCPNCNAALSWHINLENHCDQCGYEWKKIKFEHAEVGCIQAEWMDVTGKHDIQSEEVENWKLRVGKYLLRAMRPNDIMLQLPVPFYQGCLKELDEYFRRADILYERVMEFVGESISFGRFEDFSCLKLDNIELHETFGLLDDDWKSECPTALPIFIVNKYKSDITRWLVDARTMAKLLNIEVNVPDSSSFRDIEKWHTLHRKASYELIELLGIQPVYQDARVARFRYDVRQINELVKPLSVADKVSDLTVVSGLCPRLATYGGDIFQLIKSAEKGLLKVYRKPHGGINPLYVHEDEYTEWLHDTLKQKCKTPIDKIEFRRMTGIHWKALQRLINQGALKTVKGPDIKNIYFDGDSVYSYISENLHEIECRKSNSYSMVSGG
jgi:hypothetical protein